MEYLSLGIFTGSFAPDGNKRFRFKARAAAAAVELAQLVYNGVSTIFFKSSEGYTDIRDNYMSWTFHAPKDFKTAGVNSKTALDCAYVEANPELTLPEFFLELSWAAKYNESSPGLRGVEVAGWESAMRTLQLAENKINSVLGQFTSVRIENLSGRSFAEVSNFGSFEAPTGTENLFFQFMQWLYEETKSPLSDASASSFLSTDDKRLGVVLDFKVNGYSQAQMTFSFADYEE